jgi:hypothetical protein
MLSFQPIRFSQSGKREKSPIYRFPELETLVVVVLVTRTPVPHLVQSWEFVFKFLTLLGYTLFLWTNLIRVHRRDIWIWKSQINCNCVALLLLGSFPCILAAMGDGGTVIGMWNCSTIVNAITPKRHTTMGSARWLLPHAFVGHVGPNNLSPADCERGKGKGNCFCNITKWAWLTCSHSNSICVCCRWPANHTVETSSRKWPGMCLNLSQLGQGPCPKGQGLLLTWPEREPASSVGQTDTHIHVLLI